MLRLASAALAVLCICGCQMNCKDGFTPAGNFVTGYSYMNGTDYRACNATCCGTAEGWSYCKCSSTCPCWKRRDHHNP